MIETYRAFGAIPSTLAWNMTSKALEHDLVDGQCCDYASFKGMKFFEAGQKYLTEIHYTFQLQPLVLSERVYAKMPPELQKIVGGTPASTRRRNPSSIIPPCPRSPSASCGQGLRIVKLTDEDKWKEVALQKVWPAVADGMGGKEAINAFLKACGQPLWR